jgi:hypothetical protein
MGAPHKLEPQRELAAAPPNSELNAPIRRSHARVAARLMRKRQREIGLLS